jgi:hypothetical protein
MKETVTILKRDLQAKKMSSETSRDYWLGERRRYSRGKHKNEVAAANCKLIADIHQSYARDFRDMMNGG